MAYIEGRTVHDADGHVFEQPGWLEPFVSRELKKEIRDLIGDVDEVAKDVQDARAQYDDPQFVACSEQEITQRKCFSALGAFIKEERPEALDYLGVASQLVFTTEGLELLGACERSSKVDTSYALAEAHNRAMLDFCAVDRRLLPVLHLLMLDIDRTLHEATKLVNAGAAAIMIPAACPAKHSTSHIGFDTLWAQAQEARIPIVFHVGTGTRMNPTYKENGLPPVKDFIGGDGNFTSLSYMAISESPQATLSALIIDGVLERFPNLKFGVIEMGAAWVPSWMRSLDSSVGAFKRNEERLRKLSLPPSEYIRRQVRVTPYPHEPTGWIIKNSGPEVCLFSTDYPHPEGGRNPMKRFEASLEQEACTDAEKDAFYQFNFEDLMGSAMDRL